MKTTRGVRAATAAGILSLLLGVLVMTAPGAGAQGNSEPGPPGNNGTVKLDGLDLADGPGHTQAPNDPGAMEPDNDPHLTCGFQLEFFNFDAGQLADITFTAHAPTGSNGVLLAQTLVAISDDGTGGAANDPDVSLDYDVLNDFDTTQFTSVHDRHGWHVKLDLTVYDADGRKVPGAQKHKVFWVEGCQPAPEPEVEVEELVCPVEGEQPTDTDGDGMNDTCAEVLSEEQQPEQTKQPDEPKQPEQPVVVETPEPPVTPAVLPTISVRTVDPTPAPVPAAVLDTAVLPSVALRAPAPAPAEPAAVAPAALARTGTDGSVPLAAAGLGLVLLGAGLRRSSRRLAATMA